MENLKGRTLRGGLAKVCGQGANFVLRFAYIMILARLLTPEDFGLVAMVTVVTGIFELFTSAGLSSAMIQQATITNAQISKLFWVNLLVGALLALLCVAAAPVLVRFFHEPRLLWVTIAMAPAFLFGAAGVQHMAILQRQLRYVTITVIEIVALLSSIAVGIGMALAGFGYWAIVAAAVTVQAVSTICAVAVTRWVPGRFDRSTNIGSMLRYGGTVTLSGVVVYIAYNLDKVLLGRVWGVEALGVYGRAYQLINIPISNLNVAVGGVAFAALSRLQDDSCSLQSVFSQGLFAGRFDDDSGHDLLRTVCRRDCNGRAWAAMERSGADLSADVSDHSNFRDDQSTVVGAVFGRVAAPQLEHRPHDDTDTGVRLSDWASVWREGCRGCVFCGYGALARCRILSGACTTPRSRPSSCSPPSAVRCCQV